jgi:protein TonB
MCGLYAAFAGLIAAILGLTVAEVSLQGTKPQTVAQHAGNNCAAAYYPASAIRAGEQGATLLNVSISKTGEATKVEVKKSSGFADLDKASVDCVKAGWHFHPALRNGTPVESTKTYRIVWKLMSGGTVAPHLQTPVQTACGDIFSTAAAKWNSYRSTVLHFRILANGTVSQPFVGISSGDPQFDATAVQCVSHVKYAAALMDGIPTEISWNAAVDWSPHSGLAYGDAYRMGVFCVDRYFPGKIWKGDPAGSTVISYHLVEGGEVARVAIERASGNPALDEAALECVRDWRSPYYSRLGRSADIGEVERVDWKNGHAFTLSSTWQ